MKVALVCKSDATGGAAVVTLRLMKALRRNGVDARMIVVEKLTDSEYVIKVPSQKMAKLSFLMERLAIFVENGFNYKALFQIDTAMCGIDLTKIEFVREADVICLNWVNQGMLSLKGIGKLARMKKRMVWTMHDMWNMTGICHHAGYCKEYMKPAGMCACCPLLEKSFSMPSLAKQTWKRKKKLYNAVKFTFVAVSNWLARCAGGSSLMKDADIRVIPNAFPIGEEMTFESSRKSIIIFGAARVDDPVKGHITLVEATKILREKYPDIASDLELVTFGNIKDPEALKDVAIPHRHLGRISPEEIKEVYRAGRVVVSTSEWETLPGTLIEGQAWGCVPVALNHGGQEDIIEHEKTGYLVPWNVDKKENALGIARGILWGIKNRDRIEAEMHRSVKDKFSEDAVAKAYISLIKS